MNSKKTGGFIAELRKENGLTQQELADKLAVTNKAVSKWETGRGMPDISIIQSLAAALGVSAEELLNGEKMPKSTVKSDEETIKRLKIKKYVRLAAEIIITVFFAYAVHIFHFTFNGYKNVLDTYLHKSEIYFFAMCSLIFIICFALWCAVVIISAVINKKQSVLKAVIICLSFSFAIGVSLKIADFDDKKTVKQYDAPTNAVSYIDYASFYDNAFQTQITINDTNDIITEHYSAYFDSADGKDFVYTTCVSASDAKIINKYYNEQKKILADDAKTVALSSDFLKKCGLKKGFYITDDLKKGSLSLYIIKDTSFYGLEFSAADIYNKELIKEIKKL